MKKISSFVLMLICVCFSHIADAQESNFVFKADFNDGCSVDGWAAYDANGDGITWTIDEQLNGYIYNGMTTPDAANDWLFTPSFSVEAGKSYILSYTIAQRGAFEADNIVVCYGESGTPDAMSNVVIEESYNMHGAMTTRRCRIYMAQDANYVLGFNLISPAGNGIVSLKSISIEESEMCTPQAIPAMVANVGVQEVKLKWVNPKKDMENTIIRDKMNALLYLDNVLVETIENVVPGKEHEYTYKPTTFSGKHTISMSVEVNGNESEKISKEVDFDDVKGSLSPVYTFPLKKKTDFATWVTENTDNDFAKWEYYSGSAYISAMGKNVNDWLITPGCELEAGTRYVLSYELASGRDYPASLDVTVGGTQASSSQGRVLESYNDLYQNGFGAYQTVQFEVDANGTYYFGFHALYVGNSLDVRNVTINTIDAGGEVVEEELVYTFEEEPVEMDNVNGDLSVSVPYNQRLSSEGIELYGVFINANIDQYTLAPKGIYHMNYLENEYDVDLENPELAMGLAGGCVYHEGKLYGVVYEETGDYQSEFPTWVVMDAKTYEVISETRLNDNCENTTISLAYDVTSDKIYGLVKDYVDTWLVEINPETGAMKRIGDRMFYDKRYQKYLALGCNLDGELYCVHMEEDSYDGEQKQYLSRINKETGFIANIGQITGLNMMPNDMLINFKMRQSLFFNHETGKMYWFFCSSSAALGGMYGAIFELNTINANAILQNWCNDVWAISGAYFLQPNVEAPAIINNISYTPDYEGATSGVIQFTLPERTYGGNLLNGAIDYKVVINATDSIICQGTAQPGETITHKHTATEGIYDLSLMAYNTYGEGTVASYTILVGYDVPDAPQNVLLTDDGLTTTTLTWDAPETGLHGKPYDVNEITYEILRYPDNAIVATGLTETRFEETHGKDMSRYMYAVFSCANGERIRGRISNDVVIGEPLLPPYGGIFQQWEDMSNYYTVLDVNKDGYTWSYDGSTGSAFYPYNWELSADDWMISPPIKCYEGDVYTLQFTAFSTAAEYLESLLVTFGAGKTPEAQENVLMDLPELPAISDEGEVDVYNVDIVVPESGVYYYGFMAYSEPWQNYLYLYNIKFDKKADGAVENVVKQSRDFDAYSHNNGISVINPKAHDIAVYSVSGVLMHQSDAREYHIQLQPGVYMVRSAQTVIKVVVR